MKRIFFATIFLSLITSCTETNVTTGDENLYIPETPAIVGQFTQRVLIEDYTGTWCGNCTRVSLAIERVREQTDKIVVIGIHNGNDPYSYPDAAVEPLRLLIYPDTPGFALPATRLNRTIPWTVPEQNNIQDALNLIRASCPVGLAMKSTVAGGSISLDVNMRFSSDSNLSGLKLVVYALEDNLVHSQTNYLSSYGPTPTMANYIHNNVLRASFTDILGDPIVETDLAGKTISRNFTVAMPASVANPSNIHFAAFIVNSNNTAINARAIGLNETQEFEENQ